MATLISGDTLSLNNLAGATGFTQGDNVSLGTIKGSAVSTGLSSYAVDSIDSVSGYTYAVEGTSETYTLGTTGGGDNFSQISGRAANVTWGITGGDKLSVSTNNGVSVSISVSNMTNAATQTILQNVLSHTVSATFVDGYNDHIGSVDGYNVARTKTVYSVDSYDGNSNALCLTTDSPILMSDGTIKEVGELEEGDLLKGFSINELSINSDSSFLDWSTNTLSTTAKDVIVVNVIYSFTSKYYSINDGEVNATAEHPLLVKDSNDGLYKFKKIFSITSGDYLIKGDGDNIEEILVESVVPIYETTEIVSIDVEEDDTYMVNGYITHNKGGDSHTDLPAPGAPTSLAYSSPSISWVAPSSTGTNGITAYDFQIDNNSDFSSPIADVSEWSTTTAEVIVGYSLTLGGTYYARVRAIDHGLKSNWTSTLTFTA